MRGDVTGISLEADALGLEGLAEALSEQSRVALVAECVEHAVAPFENAARTLIAALRKPRRHDAVLGRTSEMQPLDHPTRAGLREGHQPASERTGDAISID